MLGCPVGTVKTHVLRAKQKLKGGAVRMGAGDEQRHDVIDRPIATSPMTEPADWLDRVLADDARDHAGGYVDDGGFVANVMRRLPAPIARCRRGANLRSRSLWGVAGRRSRVVTSPASPSTSRAKAFKLFAAKPFVSLSRKWSAVACGPGNGHVDDGDRRLEAELAPAVAARAA